MNKSSNESIPLEWDQRHALNQQLLERLQVLVEATPVADDCWGSARPLVLSAVKWAALGAAIWMFALLVMV